MCKHVKQWRLKAFINFSIGSNRLPTLALRNCLYGHVLCNTTWPWPRRDIDEMLQTCLRFKIGPLVLGLCLMFHLEMTITSSSWELTSLR